MENNGYVEMKRNNFYYTTVVVYNKHLHQTNQQNQLNNKKVGCTWPEFPAAVPLYIVML